jgi:hypothetical protein
MATIMAKCYELIMIRDKLSPGLVAVCKVEAVSRWYWRFTTAPGGAVRSHAR